jgi:hypothetical protein
MALEEGRWADAERLANESLLTARSAGVRAGLTLPLATLGMARRELGNMDGARAAHTEEAQVAEELHDPLAGATAQVNLAAVDIATGDLQGALRRYAVGDRRSARGRHLGGRRRHSGAATSDADQGHRNALQLWP